MISPFKKKKIPPASTEESTINLGDTVYCVTTAVGSLDSCPAVGQVMGLRCDPGDCIAKDAQVFFHGLPGRLRYQWLSVGDVFCSEQSANAASKARARTFSEEEPGHFLSKEEKRNK